MSAKPRYAPGDLARYRFFPDRRGEQLVVHRQSDQIEAPAGQGLHVGPPGVVGEPGFVEAVLPLGPHQVRDPLLDFILGAAGLEHIPFLQHPAAETDTAENHFLPPAVDDTGGVGAQENVRLGP